jgi:hypothetical protein
MRERIYFTIFEMETKENGTGGGDGGRLSGKVLTRWIESG